MEVCRIEIEEKKHCEYRSCCKSVPEQNNGHNSINYVKKKSRVVSMVNKMNIDKKESEKHVPDIQMINDKAQKDIDHKINNVDKRIKDNVNIRCIDFDEKKNGA
ncbi:17582_t:CDS:2 [Racocetra persica]|uniref:17582_t:CDS:1 n=1 Tax=Racocetra persica TaxID=160502 RepID=A0ACA9LGX7_9GLOM|nr:17582_t:CDS:2 [Racocetra persica]